MEYITTLELFRKVDRDGEAFFSNLNDIDLLKAFSRLSTSLYDKHAWPILSEKEIIKRWSSSFDTSLIAENNLEKEALYIINSLLSNIDKLRYKNEITNWAIQLLPFIDIQEHFYNSEGDRNFDVRTLHINLSTYQLLIEHLSDNEFFNRTNNNWWHIAALKSHFDLAAYLAQINHPYQLNSANYSPTDMMIASEATAMSLNGTFKHEQYQIYFEQEKKINGIEGLDFYLSKSITHFNQEMLKAIIHLDYQLLKKNDIHDYESKLNEAMKMNTKNPYTAQPYSEEEKKEFEYFLNTILIKEEKETFERKVITQPLPLPLTKIKNKI